MINIFRTLPPFLFLVKSFRKLNANEAALEAAHEAGDYEEERKIGLSATSEFIDDILPKFGVKVEVIGRENLPEHGPVLFVANHQSYCDVLMMYDANRKFQMGFIAKQEFEKIKLFAKSIHCTRSLFLNRGDARAAIKTIQRAKQMFDQGFSFVIFPEGTRSRKHEMGEFKHGAFKFAQKGKVPIIPVTLDGGYRMFEEKGSLMPCDTRVIIHPMVKFNEMNKEEQTQAIRDIENTIREGLKLSEQMDAGNSATQAIL